MAGPLSQANTLWLQTDIMPISETFSFILIVVFKIGIIIIKDIHYQGFLLSKNVWIHLLCDNKWLERNKFPPPGTALYPCWRWSSPKTPVWHQTHLRICSCNSVWSIGFWVHDQTVFPRFGLQDCLCWALKLIPLMNVPVNKGGTSFVFLPNFYYDSQSNLVL